MKHIASVGQRPPIVVACGLIFMLLPLFNAIGVAWYGNFSPFEPSRVIAVLDSASLTLLGLAPVVGLAVLLTRRVGWVLWVSYGLMLAVYNLVVIVRLPSWYNVGALANTVLGFAAVFIFLRKDISAPFLSVAQRGWRRSPRMLIELSVTLDGVPHSTVNLSGTGMLVRCDSCKHNAGDSIRVGLPLGEDRLELSGTVVRTDGVTTAVRFPESRRRLLQILLGSLQREGGRT